MGGADGTAHTYSVAVPPNQDPRLIGRDPVTHSRGAQIEPWHLGA